MSAEKDNFKGKVVFQLSCLRDYVCFWEVVSTTTTPVISIHLNTQSYVDFKPASLLLAEFGVQQTKFIKKSTNFSNPHLPTGYLTTKTASKKNRKSSGTATFVQHQGPDIASMIETHPSQPNSSQVGRGSD